MRRQVEMYHVWGKSRIGEGTYIGENVIIGHPGKEEVEKLLKGDLNKVDGAEVGRFCVLRANGVIYSGAKLGDRVVTGHFYMVREYTTVGEGTLIGSGVIIDDHVSIGKNVSIQSRVYIPTGSVIEDDVFLGPGAVLTNDKRMGRRGWKLEPVTVKRGARVGAGSVLLPGVTVGENAVVGAGAVVVKDVPDGAVVVGNPARVIKEVPEEDKI